LVAVTVMMWSPKISWFRVSTGQDAHWVDTYETVVGQQRSVKLRDGSTLRLNTNTRLTFELTGKERRVTLSSGGEAMFWVKRDPSRPFEVVTARATALVVGTQFNVYEQTDRTTVSVVQGGVRVLPVGAKGSPSESEARQSLPVQVSSGGILLHAEEQVSVESGGMLSAVAKVNGAELELWQQGKLSFDGVTWGEAASAFNRYNSRQLVIIGEALQGRRLNKEIFRTDSVEGFLALLRNQDPGIVVEKTRDAIVIRSR
jgi:transmembrane sensor